MRAGRLDRRIRIEKYGPGVDDGWGNPSPGYTPLGTYRAEMLKGSSEEFFRAGGMAEVEALVFRLRYLAGISTADRVAHRGQYFNIVETKEIGRRQGLEIRCVSTGEAAAE